MQGGTFSSERLRDIALDYQLVQQRNGHAIDPALVRDALPVDFELKYTPPSEVAPFKIIAQWMEQLIDQSKKLVDRR